MAKIKTSYILVAALSLILVALISTTFFTREAEVEVPNLIGLDTLEALSITAPLEIHMEIEQQRFNNKFSRGSIVNHYPTAGKRIRKGRNLRIIVSKGSESLKMLNLAGLSMRQARTKLRELGLSIGRITLIHNQHYKRNVIISQTPPPGDIVKRDQKVDILVSKGALAKQYFMPDCIGKMIGDAETTLAGKGIGISQINTIANNYFAEGTIIKQQPDAWDVIKPGEQINFTITRYPDKELDFVRYVFFTYSLEPGFIEKLARIEVKDKDGSRNAFLGFVKSGATIKKFIRCNGSSSITVYINGKEVISRSLNPDYLAETTRYIN